jgi:nicotinate dehydrogenase subunit B
MRRRDFLRSSGALIVGFSMTGRPGIAQFGGPVTSSPPLNQLDSWIAIAADGSVTAFSGKEELGQGISVAQAQLVAEELSVPFQRVTLIYCDTAFTPDQAYTAGSQSHPANFNHGNLAQACATARETLMRLASERLGVPADQLTANDGAIGNAKRSARVDRSRKTCAASRSARHRRRPIRVCTQRARTGYAARQSSQAARGGRDHRQR